MAASSDPLPDSGDARPAFDVPKALRPVVAAARRATAALMPRPAPAAEHDRLRAELILSFDLSFVAIGLLILLLIHFVFPLPDESTALARRTVPILIAGLSLSAACLRLSGSIGAAAHLTIASAFTVMLMSTALHGGIESPVLCLWTLVPLVAGLLAGRRAALAWAAGVMVFLLALHEAERTGVFQSTPIGEGVYLPSLLINMAIASGSAAAAVTLYETINANLRHALDLERAKYAYEAGHDALTGLPNRRLFSEIQTTALRRADRVKQKVGLIIVDLDDFKPVNDDFGHAAGDRLLAVVAERLRGFVRATDSVARIGGDEFAVLVELLSSEDDARRFTERLHGHLTRDAELGAGRRVRVTASIGVALYPDHGTTVEALEEAADAAMYAAKGSGRNQVRLADAAALPEPTSFAPAPRARDRVR